MRPPCPRPHPRQHGLHARNTDFRLTAMVRSKSASVRSSTPRHGHAGIVHQDIDRPEPRRSPPRPSASRSADSETSAPTAMARPPAAVMVLTKRIRIRFTLAIIDSNRGARRCKPRYGCCADAAGSPRDEGNTVLQVRCGHGDLLRRQGLA